MRRTVLLVLANKADTLHVSDEAIRGEEVEELLSLKQLKDRRYRVQCCSGHTGDGVFEGFDWVGHNIDLRVINSNESIKANVLHDKRPEVREDCKRYVVRCASCVVCLTCYAFVAL